MGETRTEQRPLKVAQNVAYALARRIGSPSTSTDSHSLSKRPRVPVESPPQSSFLVAWHPSCWTTPGWFVILSLLNRAGGVFMEFGTGKLKRWMWLCSPAVALVCGLTVALCQKQPAANEPSSVAPAQSAKAQPRAMGDGDYVGTETCVGCHDAQQKRFKNTVMGKI